MTITAVYRVQYYLLEDYLLLESLSLVRITNKYSNF